MENISNLCRICSSPGWHDIWKPIPPYVHLSPTDTDDWRMPIVDIITETTGLKVSRFDQLPQKICTICITYMKHAAVFRNQAQNNIRSLRAAQIIGMKQRRTVKDVITDRQIDFIAKDDVVHLPDDLLTDLHADEESEEEVEDLPEGCEYSALKQTCFEEDDVLTDDLMKNFNISITDKKKERKCPCCLRRHMLNETLDEHLKICVHYKLVKFITLCQKLLEIKRDKAVSPHEFVRRMIHAIKEIVKEMHYFCEDFTNLKLPMKPNHQDSLNKAAALLTKSDPKKCSSSSSSSTTPPVEKLTLLPIFKDPEEFKKLTISQMQIALNLAKMNSKAMYRESFMCTSTPKASPQLGAISNQTPDNISQILPVTTATIPILPTPVEQETSGNDDEAASSRLLLQQLVNKLNQSPETS